MTDATIEVAATPTDPAARWRTFLLYWGIPLGLFALGFGVRTWVGPLWSVSLTWIGIACTANALHCRRVHCSIMGPAYLILGLLAAGNTVGLLDVPWWVMSRGAGLSALIAFAPEWMGLKYWPGHGSASKA